jgi:hypothetical protein
MDWVLLDYSIRAVRNPNFVWIQKLVCKVEEIWKFRRVFYTKNQPWAIFILVPVIGPLFLPLLFSLNDPAGLPHGPPCFLFWGARPGPLASLPWPSPAQRIAYRRHAALDQLFAPAPPRSTPSPLQRSDHAVLWTLPQIVAALETTENQLQIITRSRWPLFVSKQESDWSCKLDIRPAMSPCVSHLAFPYKNFPGDTPLFVAPNRPPLFLQPTAIAELIQGCPCSTVGSGSAAKASWYYPTPFLGWRTTGISPA